MAGNWDLIVPEGATNLVTNPSIETNTTGWTVNAGGETLTKLSTQSLFGAYSLYCETTAAGGAEGFYGPGTGTNGIAVTANTAYTFTAYVYTAYATTQLTITWYAAGGALVSTDTQAITASAGNWVRHTLTATSPATGVFAALGVTEAAGTATPISWFTDGINFVAADHATTYIDGDQPGCEWNGTKHASTSTRSAQSRAGGRVYDLDTTYGLKLGQLIGIGAAPQSPDYEEHALLPGGSVSGVKTHGRVFTLAGSMFSTTSFANLHAQRQALYSVIDPDAVPHTDKGPQPVLLRYRGAAVTKEIACHYEGGFEGTFNATLKSFERVALRFLAPDPFWYQIGQTAAVLDSNDTATLRYVAGRLRSTGQWDDLGLTANPTTNGPLRTILVASDKTVYVGGRFTGMDGQAGRDYIAMYTPSTDTWSTVGGASDFNSDVWDLAEGPDGTIYAVGTFTDCAAVAAADYIAQWDGANWTAVGIPIAGAAAITDVVAIAFDHSGNLYVGGVFTNFADVAAADYFAKWNGSAWSAVGSGGTSAVDAIAIDSSDNIYIGGDFINWAGDANADRLAWWNGSAWAAVNSTAFNGLVNALAINHEDELYITGGFTNADDIAGADYIVKWNGASFEALSTGLAGGLPYDLVFTPDESLIVVGDFTTAGDLTTTDGIALWNGNTWLLIDINPAGTGTHYSIAVGKSDSTVPFNYDLWIGFNSTGSGYFSGTTTVTNNGTAPIYPKFVVNRSGGTSSRLLALRNEATGKMLRFDYSLLAGETLTVNMDPQKQTVTSSFFGSRWDAYLAGGDLGTWALQPGSNQITCFVDVVGAPTVTAYLLWRDAYKAAD